MSKSEFVSVTFSFSVPPSQIRSLIYDLMSSDYHTRLIILETVDQWVLDNNKKNPN